MATMIEIKVPIKLVSPNTSEHWSKRHKRSKMLKLLLRSEFNKLKVKPEPPCYITIIRVAPRMYDDDNLIASCKSLIDRIAELLIPGLAPGQADGNKGLKWSFGQERGEPKEYAVKIIIKEDQ